jgi:chromosome partitioning protein
VQEGENRMVVIADVNMKGGVGKTTVTVTLADGFARRGHRTLVVDLDSQAHATAWLRPEGEDPVSSYDVLTTGKFSKPPARATGRENLFILPATEDLMNADVALTQGIGKEALLRRALDSMKADFEFVLIDCPPNLGKSVVAALIAADAVLAPVTPSYLSMSGLVRLDEAMQLAREHLKSQAQLLGYLLFATDSREVVTREARELLAAGGKLFAAEIRSSAAAKTLAAQHQTAWDPKVDPRGAEDYARVLDEVIARATALTKAAA